MIHLCPSIADDLDAAGKETLAIETKKGGEGLKQRGLGCRKGIRQAYLLLCQVARSTEDWGRDERAGGEGGDRCSLMMTVLSLSSSWEVSMEGMVPESARSRGMVVDGRV